MHLLFVLFIFFNDENSLEKAWTFASIPFHVLFSPSVCPHILLLWLTDPLSPCLRCDILWEVLQS